MGDHRAGGNNRSPSNRHSFQHHDVRAEPDILFEDDRRLRTVALRTDRAVAPRRLMIVIDKVATGRDQTMRANLDAALEIELATCPDKHVIADH